MNRPSRFPDLSREHATAMEASDVKLDGQKVLFDKKVSLMPVAIKKEDANGHEQKLSR